MMTLCNPRVHTRRGRRLSPRRRCDKDAESDKFDVLLQALKMEDGARRQGKEVASKAGRRGSCLQKEAMLLKPWFRTQLQCCKTINLHCFKPLKCGSLLQQQ